MSEISINVVKLIYGVAFMGSKKCKGSHPCLNSLTEKKAKEAFRQFRMIAKGLYKGVMAPILEEGYLIQNYSKDPLDLSEYPIERYNENDSKILNYLDTCIISTKDLISFLFTHNQSLKLRNGEFQVFNPNFNDYNDDLLLWNFYFVFNGLYNSYFINYMGRYGPRYSYSFTKAWGSISDIETSYLPNFINSNINEIFKTSISDDKYSTFKKLTFLTFINKQDKLTSNYGSRYDLLDDKKDLFEIPRGYYHVTSEQNLLLEKRMNGGVSVITTKSAKSKERVSDDIVYFENQVIANPNIIKLPHASGTVRLQLGKRFDTEKLKDFDFGETKLILDLNPDKFHPVDDNILNLKHIKDIRHATFNHKEVRCEDLYCCYGNIKNAYIESGIDCYSFDKDKNLSLHIENLFTSNEFREIQCRGITMKFGRIDVSNADKLTFDLGKDSKTSIKEITCSTEKTKPFKFFVRSSNYDSLAEQFKTPLNVSENIKEIKFEVYVYNFELVREEVIDFIKKYLPEYNLSGQDGAHNSLGVTLIRKN